MAKALNCKCFGSLSVVLFVILGVNKDFKVILSNLGKIETFLTILCMAGEKKRSIYSMLYGQNTSKFRILNSVNFLYEKVGVGL